MSGSSGHSTELLWLVGSIFCIYDCHLKKKWTETFLSHIFFPQIFSFYGFVIRNILNYQCYRLECSLPLVKRKSAKACVFPNFAPAGILGPNGGTSFERLTATLGTERNRDSHKPKYSAMLVNILVMLLCVDFFYCNPLIYPKISQAPRKSKYWEEDEQDFPQAVYHTSILSAFGSMLGCFTLSLPWSESEFSELMILHFFVGCLWELEFLLRQYPLKNNCLTSHHQSAWQCIAIVGKFLKWLLLQGKRVAIITNYHFLKEKEVAV